MEFLEWLVVEECYKEHAKKYTIINELANIISEAANTTGFLEEKLNKSKKVGIKQESWKYKLSKVNWKNILENEDEDEDGPVELENPFSDDDSAQPIAGTDLTADYSSERSISSSQENKDKKRLEKLKKIKDAMLIIRWSAMKERGELSDERILSILTPQIVRKAEEDIGNLLYRIKITDEGEEKGMGILSKAIYKAYIRSKGEYDLSEIFSTFITNLFTLLRSSDSDLPERLGKFSDLDKDDSNTLNRISYYLVSMVSNAPKQDARDAARQSRIDRKRSWSNTESGGGFRRRRDKRTVVNSDLREGKLDFYIKTIDALKDVKVWDDDAKQQLKAINSKTSQEESEDIGKLRKGIIEDMFLVKLLPDSSATNEQKIRELLNDYLRIIQTQETKAYYQKTVAASTLRKDDDDGGGDDIEIARYNNSMGPKGDDDGFGKSRMDDPAKLASDAEEKRLGSTESFFGAFKAAMNSLLREKPNFGLAYCLSKNLDCSSGFPSEEDAIGAEKVKAKDVAEKMTEILKTPISQSNVNNYVNSAKNYLISYFSKNYPQFSDTLLSLLGKK